MKKYYLIGNHKMNVNYSENINFIKEVNKLHPDSTDIFFAIAPSYTNLICKQLLAKENNVLKIGAQNVSCYTKGAYTGDISANQLADMQMDFVIVGHSERRTYFHDDSNKINLRIKEALKHNLKVVLCIGETFEEFHSKETLKIISKQIDIALDGVDETADIIISYEPIWAIGTGLVASNEHLAPIFEFLQNKLPKCKFLYGGSANPGNIMHLLEIPQITGFLVGNASLSPEKFVSMLNMMELQKK
ncbi:triose-phosphate isomerase family protein [Mycoplasma phocoenae]|uniref:Triosephosphate isomerase n=1 Tax=Mycoplasma phocoenae TaxID=754517 RepID=A0A858U4P4_9MOLU|nr:triose-phosphate isomerase family protein [Mycoplasma phocoenae]QJG67049.1 triosephosphate isomerase [Mycoplasma phocoenae]